VWRFELKQLLVELSEKKIKLTCILMLKFLTEIEYIAKIRRCIRLHLHPSHHRG
jgi:hypothetical protein